jgi:hypothetical protein
MHMSSAAKEKSAEGVCYLNKFTLPFVGDMGTQSSFAQNGFDPEGAVAMAEASSNDVALLGGLIKIDSVITRATARSDGVKGTVAGTTTVSGAEVAGTKVIIDNAGVHVADQNTSTAAQQQALNQVLNQAGVTMELAPPVDTHAGPKASRSLNGLLIRIKSETLEPIIAALPAELQTEIRGQVTFDQAIAIQLAPAVVTAGAAKTIAFEPPVDVPPVAGGTDTGGNTEVSGSETGVGEPSVSDVPSSDTGSTGSVTDGEPIAIEPVKTTYQGIPVWLVVLMVLLALASSRPLTAFADRVFAAAGAGRRCPDEDA